MDAGHLLCEFDGDGLWLTGWATPKKRDILVKYRRLIGRLGVGLTDACELIVDICERFFCIDAFYILCEFDGDGLWLTGGATPKKRDINAKRETLEEFL